MLTSEWLYNDNKHDIYNKARSDGDCLSKNISKKLNKQQAMVCYEIQ